MGTGFKWEVIFSILYGMTGFVGGNSGGSHRWCKIDILT